MFWIVYLKCFFSLNDKKKVGSVAALIVKRRQEGPQEEMTESTEKLPMDSNGTEQNYDMAFDSAVKDIMEAVESKSSEKLKSALKSFISSAMEEHKHKE